MRNRTHEAEFRDIAGEYGLEPADVKRIVQSFFEVFAQEANALPFDNVKKIFSKDKFKGYVKVRNIPGIGRLGPSYSRYLQWRVNEAKEVDFIPKPKKASRYSQEDIEKMAIDVLSGKSPEMPRRVRQSDQFSRVWLVGTEGKKTARQVIPKKTKVKTNKKQK